MQLQAGPGPLGRDVSYSEFTAALKARLPDVIYQEAFTTAAGADAPLTHVLKAFSAADLAVTDVLRVRGYVYFANDIAYSMAVHITGTTLTGSIFHLVNGGASQGCYFDFLIFQDATNDTVITDGTKNPDRTDGQTSIYEGGSFDTNTANWLASTWNLAIYFDDVNTGRTANGMIIIEKIAQKT